MNQKEKAKIILNILEETYSDATITLDFEDPVQLMVSTQLAAQCTDARVNIVTKDLFKKYPDVYAFASADQTEFEQDIRSTGFYRNKAKNIINASKMLIEDFGGQVPSNMEDLLKLPGVGRKTANIILGDFYGVPGVVIDTHAGRLARRMGFTKNNNPEKVEYDLMKIFPKEKWTGLGHLFVFHGRAVCNARKPKCSECTILPYCQYGQTELKQKNNV